MLTRPKSEKEKSKISPETNTVSSTPVLNPANTLQEGMASLSINIIPPSEQKESDRESDVVRGRSKTHRVRTTETRSQPHSLLPRAESVITLKPKHTHHSISPSRTALTNTTPYSQSFFAPVTNTIYNAAMLYNLLIDSTVKSTQKITSYPNISLDDMMLDDVNSLDDNRLFQLGFTRKYCSYTSINHASLAFRDLTTGKFLIVGRQNEQFLKADPNLPPPSFGWWAFTNALHYNSYLNFTVTRMDNEKKYDFFPGTPFNAEMTEVIMTGAEIKHLIKSVDDNICFAQRYNVVSSNCYSSVLFGLAKAFAMTADKVDAHTDDETIKANNKDLKRLFTLICSALQDNYQLGSGGINNEVVNIAIQNTIDILEQRNLLNIIDSTFVSQNSSRTTASESKDEDRLKVSPK